MAGACPLLISLKIRGFTAIFSLRNTPATFDAYHCDDGQSGRDVVIGADNERVSKF